MIAKNPRFPRLRQGCALNGLVRSAHRKQAVGEISADVPETPEPPTP